MTFNGTEGVARKEGKGLLATKMTTEKKDKAKKAPIFGSSRACI
jgi:hypothetical protein